MKKIISRILIAYALAVLLCTLYLNQCIAQNPKQNKTSLSEYSVRGKVTDTHNVPMPGVTVRYNHIIGTATDNDGNFTLRLPEETGTLTFSFIGYKTLNIPFTAGVPLSVRMTEEISSLDEVQVIAYGQQSKRDMVGAMSVVKSKDIQDIPSPSVANLLQGKVAGMNVVNMTGSPGGGGTSITIRGFNSLSVEASRRFSDPLWVIDGVPMLSFTSPITGTNALAEIDPNDIETISVLKDAASAAIYGSRAANGVILVTTKHGRYNQRPRMNLNFSHTIVCRPDFPDLTRGKAEREFRTEALRNYREAIYDEETGKYRYMESYWDSYVNGTGYDYFWNNGEGRDVPILTDYYNPFYNNSTDWFKYYFRTAHATDANLQINGGADRVAYNVGLGWYQEKGALIKTGFKRFKVISNLTMKPHDRIEANLRLYMAYTNRDRSGKGNGIYSADDEAYLEKIPSEILTTSTLLPGPGSSIFDEQSQRYEKIEEKNDSYRLRGNFDLSYQLLPGLTLKGSLAIDFSQQNQNQFIPAELNPYNETYSAGLIGRNITWINEDIITYKHTFGDSHNIDLMAGFSAQADEKHDIRGFGQNGPDKMKVVNWASNTFDQVRMQDLKDFMSDFTKSTMVGLFGRINYNYMQKYLASFTIRRDASSRFGENVRWGTFPSVALGYAFSEESYMDWSDKVIDYGKIRLSYGKSGRQFDQPYIAYGVWASGDPYLGEPSVHPVFRDGLMNRELTWEETRQFDSGLDLDLFNYRLGIVLDYYHRYTDKLLYKVNLPGNYTGFEQQWRNAYGIVNQGIEFQIKTDLIRTERLKWNITFNIAKNWNMLKKSNDKRDFISAASYDNINVVGRPLNCIYVFRDHGFYTDDSQVSYYYIDGKKVPLRGAYGNQFYQTGDRVYLDSDGNGRINSDYGLNEDRVSAGSPLPKAQGGIISSLNWKGFDVNVSFAFMLGRHILNKTQSESIGTFLGTDPNDVAKPIFADLSEISFWEKPGDIADYPANRLENGLMNFAPNIASNVENVSFLKCKTLTIGYTIPEFLKKKIGFGARIFVSAENLFTLTNYSGRDPETVDVVTGVDDLANYPLSRRFTFGLTLNL